ncbi:MAG: NTP transferase domain-containing protein [bacterium]|nr:NTP transferase domain-containing protein [bacterium]
MIVIVIPAKGHSNRLPNKNMVDINGRPMLDYAIDQAIASTRAGMVVVSTDSDAIAAHATSRGIRVVRRPESLGGETPLLDVYRQALTEINNQTITMIVGLQADHPDRSIAVDDAIAAFEAAGPTCDVLGSTDASGTKNGAHYILSRQFVDAGEYREKVMIVDDCTNVHTPEDLSRAAARLRARVAVVV